MWFTRGIVAAPSVERAVQAIIDRDTKEAARAQPARRAARPDQHRGQPAAPGPGRPVLPALKALLTDVKARGLTLYAALYELNYDELIGLLQPRPSCHLLLGNGSYSSTSLTSTSAPPNTWPASSTCPAASSGAGRSRTTSSWCSARATHRCRSGPGPPTGPSLACAPRATTRCTFTTRPWRSRSSATGTGCTTTATSPGAPFCRGQPSCSFAGQDPGTVAVPGQPAVGVRAWHAALPLGQPAGWRIADRRRPRRPGRGGEAYPGGPARVLFLMFQPGPAATSLIKPIEDLASSGKFAGGAMWAVASAGLGLSQYPAFASCQPGTLTRPTWREHTHTNRRVGCREHQGSAWTGYRSFTCEATQTDVGHRYPG